MELIKYNDVKIGRLRGIDISIIAGNFIEMQFIVRKKLLNKGEKVSYLLLMSFTLSEQTKYLTIYVKITERHKKPIKFVCDHQQQII